MLFFFLFSRFNENYVLRKKIIIQNLFNFPDMQARTYTHTYSDTRAKKKNAREFFKLKTLFLSSINFVCAYYTKQIVSWLIRNMHDLRLRSLKLKKKRENLLFFMLFYEHEFFFVIVVVWAQFEMRTIDSSEIPLNALGNRSNAFCLLAKIINQATIKPGWIYI